MPSRFVFSALALSLYISSTLGIALASDSFPIADQQINKQIHCFQMPTSELRTKQKTQQQQKKIPFKEKTKRKTNYNYYPENPGKKYYSSQYQKCKHYASGLDVEPHYLNKDVTFGGSKLIVNIPTVREDSQLLLRQYRLIQKFYELNIPMLDFPRVTLTGKLEGQTYYESTNMGSKSANVNFSGAELDTYIQDNSWVLGYMSLDYDPDEHRDGSRIFMNRAFVTIGNLSQFPLYTSIGQVYVPFGRYSSLMVTTPVTQALGRTRARTLTLGYQQTGNNVFHAEIYGFRNPANNIPHSKNEWGIDIGYEFNDGCLVNGEVGAGYISSITDSQGMQTTTVVINTENLRHRIPALNIYGTLDISPVVLLAEYVGTVAKSFDNDRMIGFINHGVLHTRAFHAEMSYMLKTSFNNKPISKKPSSIGVGYDYVSQVATLLGLPQDRYSIFYNINIWRDTNLSIEYRRDMYYHFIVIPPTEDSNLMSINMMTTNVKKRSDNVVTVQFDLFF